MSYCWKQCGCERRQLHGAEPESDRLHNNRMFTACGSPARDNHKQAATLAVAGNTSEEEMQAGQIPSRCTEYNHCCFVYTDSLPVWGLFKSFFFPQWPLEKENTVMADGVSCRWQWTDRNTWFLTFRVGWSLFTVTSCFFFNHQCSNFAPDITSPMNTWVNSSVSSRVWILPVCHRTKRPAVTWRVSSFHLSWSDQIPLV